MEYSKQTESKKWGTSLRFGWTAVPNMLLRKQGELQLSSDDLIILINLIRFWWRYDRFPYPSVEKTSKETGFTEEKIKNIIDDLEKKGFLRKVGIGGGKYGYDLSPLSRMLSSFSTTDDENIKVDKEPQSIIAIIGDDNNLLDVISEDNFIDYNLLKDGYFEIISMRRDINNQNIEPYVRKVKIIPYNEKSFEIIKIWNSRKAPF
jgi:DNA-binding Lrp family transcriptional regulator